MLDYVRLKFQGTCVSALEILDNGRTKIRVSESGGWVTVAGNLGRFFDTDSMASIAAHVRKLAVCQVKGVIRVVGVHLTTGIKVPDMALRMVHALELAPLCKVLTFRRNYNIVIITERYDLSLYDKALEQTGVPCNDRIRVECKIKRKMLREMNLLTIGQWPKDTEGLTREIANDLLMKQRGPMGTPRNYEVDDWFLGVHDVKKVNRKVHMDSRVSYMQADDNAHRRWQLHERGYGEAAEFWQAGKDYTKYLGDEYAT